MVGSTAQSILAKCGQALAAGELHVAETLAHTFLMEQGEDSAIRGVIGAVRLEQGDYQGAITEYTLALKWAALSSDGPNPDIYFAIGLAQHKLGDLAKACQSWVRAVGLNPCHEDAVINGAQAALQLQDWDLALAICQTSIQAGNETAQLWAWSGHALAKQGQDDHSAVAYGRAVTLTPRDVALRYMHALALRDSQQYDLARKGLEAVLLLEPDHADAAFDAAQLDLMQQHWQSGFSLWDSRLRRKLSLLPENLPGSLWDGAYKPEATLLVQAEQGFGDTLQFMRYLPLAEQKVGHVVLRVHAGLVRLCKAWRPDLNVVSFEAPVLANLHVPLLSLPSVLEAWSPYAEAATYLSHLRSATKNQTPCIGLVWAGNPVHHNDYRRSAPFTAFQKLADVPNVNFVHFQIGCDATVTASWPALQDGTQNVADFLDTAQVLAHCDLMISVDTAVAHLASAMSIPTWVLVPDVPDWRWGESGDTTPWYPNNRVLRQTQKNDWDELLSRVRTELLTVFN